MSEFAFFLRNDFHQILFLPWIQAALYLAFCWDKLILCRSVAVHSHCYFSLKFILNHIFHNMGLTFIIHNFGIVFEPLLQRQYFSILHNDFAVSPVVQLSPNIVFDEDIDFLFGVKRKNKKLFLWVLLNCTILPVNLIFLPEFFERLKTNPLLVFGVGF